MPDVKFLIVRFSSIGDIILTTPVVRCLKEQVDGAEIHYLTKKKFTPLVENNPYIDKVWSYHENFRELMHEIKYQHLDYIIDLHNNLRSRRVKSALKLISFSFNKINFEKWMMVNLKRNRLPDVHVVDRYLETIKAFDVRNDQNGLDYFITGDDKKLPDPVREQIPSEFIALAIGANHYTKKLPSNKCIEIINWLKLPVVILGGPTDQDEAKLILSGSKAKVINTAGKLSLHQSAYLIQLSKVLITHDTGMMHVGAALKKKVISVWGNTIPEFGMYPYLPHPQSKIFEVHGLNCRPCSKIGFKECPKGHFKCMVDQNTKEIADYVNGIC